MNAGRQDMTLRAKYVDLLPSSSVLRDISRPKRVSASVMFFSQEGLLLSSIPPLIGQKN